MFVYLIGFVLSFDCLDALFNAFVIAAFFEFIMFSLCEMRFLLILFKARHPEAFSNGWERMRRELAVLYARFYGFLIGGLIVLYYFQHAVPYFMFLFYSFWIPQIAWSGKEKDETKSKRVPHQQYFCLFTCFVIVFTCSAYNGTNNCLLPSYILGISVSRLLVPLYLFGCPANFLNNPPNVAICVTLTM